MKVTVLGTSGMLGNMVSRFFREAGDQVTSISRAEFDVERDSIEKLRPLITGREAIINCIGVVKSLEKSVNPQTMWQVNAIFPRNLSLICHNTAPLIHISTDCVYSGEEGLYDETHAFDPQDLYGVTKLAGETSRAMNLRTSIIGEELSRNRGLLEWARSQKGAISGYTNHHWNGVTTLHLAEMIRFILTTGRYHEGTFHVFSPEDISKFDLLKLINHVYRLGLEIHPVQTKPGIDRRLRTIFPLCSQLPRRSLEAQLNDLLQAFQSETRKRAAS